MFEKTENKREKEAGVGPIFKPLILTEIITYVFAVEVTKKFQYKNYCKTLLLFDHLRPSFYYCCRLKSNTIFTVN